MKTINIIQSGYTNYCNKIENKKHSVTFGMNPSLKKMLKTEICNMAGAIIIPMPIKDIPTKYFLIKSATDTVKLIHVNLFTNSIIWDTRKLLKAHYPSNFFRPVLAAIDGSVNFVASCLNGIKKAKI